MSNIPQMLPRELSDRIIAYIAEHAVELNARPEEGRPLGAGIFDVLESRCSVMYYPIEDAQEHNAAFLLSDIPMRDGSMKNVVFINTFQTTEKQVFSAAHELGHLLRIPEVLGVSGDEELEERVVNRFAAELLMPADLVRPYAIERIDKVPGFQETRTIKLGDLLKVIAAVMDYCSVPYNAAVIRMVELEILKEEHGRLLVDGSEQKSLDAIKGTLQNIISETQYQGLQVRSMRRGIAGLAELLNRADETALYSEKIASLRRKFALYDIDNNGGTLSLKEPSKG